MGVRLNSVSEENWREIEFDCSGIRSTESMLNCIHATGAREALLMIHTIETIIDIIHVS
jgi:hypothetical protein